MEVNLRAVEKLGFAYASPKNTSLRFQQASNKLDWALLQDFCLVAGQRWCKCGPRSEEALYSIAYLTARQTRMSPVPHLEFLPLKGPAVLLTKKKGCPKDKKGGQLCVLRAQLEIHTRVICKIERKPRMFLKCLALSISAKRSPTAQCSCSNFVVLNTPNPFYNVKSSKQ